MYQKISKFVFLAGVSTLTVIGASSIMGSTKAQQQSKNSQDKRPNIVLIVADDMGYSDLGAYGSEISTPNIDALAKKGTMFTNYHTAPTCSPSRSMLLTGVDNHRAGLGQMHELLSPNQKGKPGYEGVLNNRVVTFPTLLKDAGYHTYITGKWHLGDGEADRPNKKGFEKSFVMLQGGGDHYSKRGFDPKIPVNTFSSDGKIVETLPKDFYSTKFYTDQMIEFIENNRKDGKPFFTFLAYTAPHSPYQAPDEYVQKYIQKYSSGWDQLREERLKKMQQLGLVPDYLDLPPKSHEAKDWNSFTPEQRRQATKTMALYAAMIDYLDMSVGRFIDYLKKTGEYDNTIFVFISDNGADGHNRKEDDSYEKWFQQIGVDNSYENMGKPNSFVTRGMGWAQVSATPFFAEKATESEAGIRAPLMVYYPAVIKAGKRTDAFASVKDITPTFLEYAGVKPPGTSFQGRPIYPVEGKSLRPLLEGRAERIYDQNEPFGAESSGNVNKALFLGDWKILKLDPPFGDRTWKLYNLRLDPRELNDLSQQYPKQLKKMVAAYEQYEKNVGFVPAKP